MPYVIFVACAAVVVLAGVKLSEYADAIAHRTRLGGLFVGTLLLAGATSLPEFLSTISSVRAGYPNLAAGNVFGSNMFNMLLLGLLDIAYFREHIIRRVAMRHALTASLANLLSGLAVLSILARVDLRIGWVGLDSLALIAAYLVGVRLLQVNAGQSSGGAEAESKRTETDVPGLRRAVVGFLIAAAALTAVSPFLVDSAEGIAQMTGMARGFAGAVLLATVTSLPEMVAMIAAARAGAYDLAVGNLFGSNMFNLFALGLTDLFYTRGRFLGDIDPVFALAGLLGLLLTTVGLIGNLARVERRILFVEVDALLLVLGYFAGMALLYVRGAAG